MLTKSRLKEIFGQYNFRPLKRYGENYLIDANIKDKMIRELAPSKDDTVLEIGPGMGALTIDIALSGARTIAVEKDKKAFLILSEIVDENYPNLTLLNGDILDYVMEETVAPGKIKVIGSLPYYITTPIIEYLIKNRPRVSIVVMLVQREVANRIMASAGTDDYSSLSCFIQYYSKPAYIHTVKRTSFYPEPDVDSSLLRLDLLSSPSVEVKDEKLLFKIIRGAFNQRRKSISNSLSRKAVLDIPKEALARLLAEVKIDPASRPETLSLEQFAKIANCLIGNTD